MLLTMAHGAVQRVAAEKMGGAGKSSLAGLEGNSYNVPS